MSVYVFRFGDKTEHLIINESCSDLSTEAVYRIQAKLNLLHPSIYPLLPKQLEATVYIPNIEVLFEWFSVSLLYVF